jgi:hypothetical protein
MDRRAKNLAEEMLLSYGERATEDRDLIADVLDGHGLDCEPEDIDDFIRYARWLWEE